MNPKNKWLIGFVAASTIATATMLEGRRNDPYLDIIGKATVCDGETQVEMRHYTNAECDAMTKRRLVEFGDGVLKCVNVPINQNEHAAYTLFTYNVGTSTFCRSTIVKRLNAGDHVGACNFLLEYSYAGGKIVQGLRNRRVIEQRLCLKGLT